MAISGAITAASCYCPLLTVGLMTGVLFKGIHDAIQEWRSGDKTFNQLLLAVGESAAKLVGQAACGMSCAWLGTQVGLAAGGGVGAAVGFAAGSVLGGLFAKFHLGVDQKRLRSVAHSYNLEGQD